MGVGSGFSSGNFKIICQLIKISMSQNEGEDKWNTSWVCKCTEYI